MCYDLAFLEAVSLTFATPSVYSRTRFSGQKLAEKRRGPLKVGSRIRLVGPVAVEPISGDSSPDGAAYVLPELTFLVR